jgi:hypothetical protein
MTMANLLRQSSEWLENQRTRHAASQVEYLRGSRSVDISATIGKTTFEIDDGYGMLVRHESRDFLVLATDLVLADQSTLPQRGDRIREPQGQQVFVYEVTAPGKEPCWRYSDSFRKTLRIHTQQVDMEAITS